MRSHDGAVERQAAGSARGSGLVVREWVVCVCVCVWAPYAEPGPFGFSGRCRGLQLCLSDANGRRVSGTRMRMTRRAIEIEKGRQVSGECLA